MSHYVDPGCRFAKLDEAHVCRRRDGRLLQPFEDCWVEARTQFYEDQPELFHAEMVVEEVANGLILESINVLRAACALDAWDVTQALDMQTVERQGDEQAFWDWLLGSDR